VASPLLLRIADLSTQAQLLGSGHLGWRDRRENRFPIQNRIPNETMIAPIHIPVKGIEVERHDVAATGRHIENRWTVQNIFFAPGLPADDKWSARRVAPFEDDPRAVFGTIQAGGAIGHAQPRSRNIVEWKILAEDAERRRGGKLGVFANQR